VTDYSNNTRDFLKQLENGMSLALVRHQYMKTHPTATAALHTFPSLTPGAMSGQLQAPVTLSPEKERHVSNENESG